jgi:hypothetical protein
LERQVILETVHHELSDHEITKQSTSFIKEVTWRVVKVQGKNLKVVDHQSSGIVVISSRGIWTIDLSRGRFRISGSGSLKDLEKEERLHHDSLNQENPIAL